MHGYELEARYDARQSFYGKARVEEQDNGDLHLISYTTHVATITRKEGEKIAQVFGLYSQTTTRHIKEFLQQNGFYVKDSKQISKDYAAFKS